MHSIEAGPLRPVIRGADGIIGPSLKHLALLVVSAFFHTLVTWVVAGDQVALKGLWSVMSFSTNPVVSGSWFSSDFSVMATIGAAVCVPLLSAAAIQAVARQDGSGLVRTACVKLPFALLFTAVAVQLVQLGLALTDQASAALLSSGGGRVHGLLQQLTVSMSSVSNGFVQFLLAVIECFVCFFVWFELVVRSGAVAVATLFLPLALAGLAWPATSHWARRLGETLVGLILLKLVIAGVLALAVGAFNDHATGLSGVMEGIALLGLAAMAPFSVFRLIPMIESGAVSHLDGLGHRAPALATGQGYNWVTSRFGDRPDGRVGSAGSAGSAPSAGSAGGGSFGGGLPWTPPTRSGGPPPSSPPPPSPPPPSSPRPSSSPPPPSSPRPSSSPPPAADRPFTRTGSSTERGRDVYDTSE